MITIPWNLLNETPDFIWAVKVVLRVKATGALAANPMLVTGGQKPLTLGGDVYSPTTGGIFQGVSGIGETTSRLTPRPCQILIADNPAWAWRERMNDVGADTIHNADLAVSMATADGRNLQIRSGVGTGWRDQIGGAGRELVMSFKDPLLRTGDTRIRVIDPEVQKNYDITDTAFDESLEPFSGFWGWNGGGND